MAISRLMLDNFPHIKAYWVMLGIKTAQVALSFGADDLDGTVVHEKIYHEAGAETPQEITVAEIRRLIAEAGRVPVERDTLYHKVERDGRGGQAGRADQGRQHGRGRPLERVACSHPRDHDADASCYPSVADGEELRGGGGRLRARPVTASPSGAGTRGPSHPEQ